MLGVENNTQQGVSAERLG